jgi:hypothetical protein
VPGRDQGVSADFEAARVVTVLVFVAQDPVTADELIPIPDRGTRMNVNFHGSGKYVERPELTRLECRLIDGDDGSKADPRIPDLVTQQAISKHTQSIRREKTDDRREDDLYFFQCGLLMVRVIVADLKFAEKASFPKYSYQVGN